MYFTHDFSVKFLDAYRWLRAEGVTPAEAKREAREMRRLNHVPPSQQAVGLRFLGRVMTRLAEHAREESDGYDDLRAFGAPSECYRDARRWLAARAEQLVERLERETGMDARMLLDEITLRCSARWLHYRGGDVEHVIGEVLAAREEREQERERQRHRLRARLPDADVPYRPTPQGEGEYRTAVRRVLLGTHTYDHKRRRTVINPPSAEDVRVALEWSSTPRADVLRVVRHMMRGHAWRSLRDLLDAEEAA